MSAVLTMNGLAPVDPKVRNLLQDRATADANPIVRLLAVLTLKGLAPADPKIRELLHNRATADANKIVRHAALQGLIEFAPDILVIRDLLRNRAITADRDWFHQLVIRIATCSASFHPDAMPSIGSTIGP